MEDQLRFPETCRHELAPHAPQENARPMFAGDTFALSGDGLAAASLLAVRRERGHRTRAGAFGGRSLVL